MTHLLRRRRNAAIGLVSVLLLVLTVGCSSKSEGPILFPVSGTVTMNGRPVSTGGTVSFRSEGAWYQPSGIIQADGTYTLKSGGKVGAPGGKYRVVVFVSSLAPRDMGGNSALPGIINNRKYLSANTTPLSAEVGKNTPPDEYNLVVSK